MDTQILFTALTSFFLFLILCGILFRVTRQDAAIAWMIRICIGIGLATIAVCARSWGLTEYVWWVSVYGLLTALFVFGLFSIMEASLTLRIFSEVARSGRIESTASRIIRRRIERLLYSGEIVQNQGALMRGKPSYFRFREIFLDVFRLLFP